MKPDPFVTAFSNFTPRPGAKVSITRESDDSISEGKQNDEWLAPPSASQCPTYRFLDAKRRRVDFWHADMFGRPCQLLDGVYGGVVEKDSDLDRYVASIIRALSFSPK